MKVIGKIKKNRKSLKFITVMLAAVTAVVWLALLFYKHNTTGVEFNVLLDDIIANILGMLPPIIIFNFAYEYFTKDYVAEDISEQLMETLTGNASMMNNFKEDVRRNFVESTVASLVGDEKCQMAYDVIKPYIDDTPYNIRDNFKYYVNIGNYTKEFVTENPYIDFKQYYKLTERLTYKKHLADKNEIPSQIKIGLFAETIQTEKELRGKDYLFRENLKISKGDLNSLMEHFANINEEEKKKFLTDFFKLELKIDNVTAEISDVKINRDGISADFNLVKPIIDTTFLIDIDLTIPQFKKHSEVLISISEPTFEPDITFTYQPETTEVAVYQFLNSDAQLVNDSEFIEGHYNIHPREWIYPAKGIVFVINDKENIN